MKTRTTLFALLLLGALTLMSNMKNPNSQLREMPASTVGDSLLRHVVLFKFKEDTPAAKVQEIESAFAALQQKIPQIYAYEWGLNNSPENLNKGFTHCFVLSFKSEEDRAIYLPHPDHKHFGSLLGSHLEDVLVVDYWTH
jgi:mannosyltransferase OCH1-like enzyme